MTSTPADQSLPAAAPSPAAVEVEYLVPAAGELAVAELEIKKSRFIAWIGRSDDEAAARELIALARQEYPDACHHCSAFQFHVDGANSVERFSDDGEPSGTAGKPMLEVLRGSGLSNIAAVVIRYFGGVKLGTGGLVRAYSDAVTEALQQVPRVRRRLRTLVVTSAEVGEAGRIEAELRARGFHIVETKWAEEVSFDIAVSEAEIAAVDAAMAELTKGAAAPARRLGRQWQEVPA